MRLCIIENGQVPADLSVTFGSYPAMVQQWLQPALPDARFNTVSAVQGEPMPACQDYDGYILTGSKFSVYDEYAWIDRLRTFVKALGEARVPMFGICFGHQLMAEAFGGRTAKARQGWGIGQQIYHYQTPERADAPALVFHQDQVVAVPASAQVLGGSEHCPYGVLAYAFPALSVQYHPEFTTEYVQALAKRYAGDLISHTEAEAVLQGGATQPVNNRPTAAWVARFFRQHCTVKT